MKAQRIFRPSRKTPKERGDEKALREKLQQEKPSLQDLVGSGDCDPDAVMTMGMYFDVQTTLRALKQALGESVLRVYLFLFFVVFVAGCANNQEKRAKPVASEAESYYRKGTEVLETDPAKAIELLTKSLELNPNAPPAIYNRAVAHGALGHHAEAVADIDRLERVAPKIGRELRAKMRLAAGGYADMAAHEFRASKFEVAIKQCDAALAYDPQWGDAWAIKGLALDELGKTATALECLNKGIAAEADNFLVYYARGEFYRKRKRLSDALADYSKSIELDPHEEALLGRSAVFDELQMPDMAKSDRSKAATLKAKRESKAAP